MLRLVRLQVAATVLYVLRDGEFIALAVVEVVPGLIAVLDTRTGDAWVGRLTRAEHADAVELLRHDRVMQRDETMRLPMAA